MPPSPERPPRPHRLERTASLARDRRRQRCGGGVLVTFLGLVLTGCQPSRAPAEPEPAERSESTPAGQPTPCPPGMVPSGDVCIDRYEASVVRLDGSVFPHYLPPIEPGLRAESRPGEFPQGHTSQTTAKTLCERSGKRLCSRREWMTACGGEGKLTFPYGARERLGACNDRGREPFGVVFPKGAPWDMTSMNDPRLLQVTGTVARAGRFSQCRSEDAAYDLVGNLHEWTSDPEGTLAGGYFLDTTRLGTGCHYRTTGHDVHYSDYSTGFRCCAELYGPRQKGR